MFSGDVFLGSYAGNYFAKPFLPTTAAQLQRASEVEVFLEDEMHALFLCSRYQKERQDFWHDVSPDYYQKLQSRHGMNEKIAASLASQSCQDWNALARLLARLRSSWRSLRMEFQVLTAKLMKHSFNIKRAIWRSKRLAVCRQGTFFDAPAGFKCSRMRATAATDERWHLAVHMAAMPRPSGHCGGTFPGRVLVQPSTFTEHATEPRSTRRLTISCNFARGFVVGFLSATFPEGLFTNEFDVLFIASAL